MHMADGMWTMNENGEFHLEEPYRTMLMEAKLAATASWRTGLLSYLEKNSPYTRDELAQELVRRNEQGGDPMETFEEFVLGALSGDL